MSRDECLNKTWQIKGHLVTYKRNCTIMYNNEYKYQQKGDKRTDFYSVYMLTISIGTKIQ